ncbi:MAG: TolB family protein [Anaerolineales bacterium]
MVYIVDGDIFLWTEGGVPNQLTFNGDAVDVLLSDDASVVVFVRSIDSAHNEIWAINSNGTNERLLVSQQEFAAELDLPGALAVVPHKIAWAPGRRLLAYNTRYVFDGPGLMQRGDLNLVNADTLEKSQLLPPGAAGSGDDFVYEPGMAGEFLYSPDGGQIALSTPNSISLMAADGSNLLPDILQYEVVITYSEYAYHARPRWALDGGALRVMIPPEDPLAEPPPDTTLWHIPSDGSPATPLGSFPVSPFYFSQGSGHPISPDLNRFAYLHDAGGGANELHLADVDGSNDVVYVTGQLLKFHGWAPDSQRFAYSVGDSPPMLGQVGAAPLPLTDVTTQAGALVWVDDGKVLFVNISQPVELRLGVVGGVSTVIDYFAAGDALPQFDFTQ